MIAACVAAFAQQNAAPLLLTGAFHGDEVHARTGERWIGLTPTAAGFDWRTFSIATRRVEDVVMDAPGEKTGIEVGVGGGAPVFLLKNFPGLMGKRVKTALYSPGGMELPASDALKLSCLADCGYAELRVVDRRMSDDDPDNRSRLVLKSNDGNEQTLHEWPTGLTDQHCELIWAGDLDGDGKMDLFMAVSDHYNVTEWTLFMSSKAPKGKLLERAAVFVTTGC